jgi:ABC-type uncharacterized transport system fused permease/ATPase subunit
MTEQKKPNTYRMLKDITKSKQDINNIDNRIVVLSEQVTEYINTTMSFKSQCLSENFKLRSVIQALEGRINDLHTEFTFQTKMLIVVVVLIFSMLMIGDNIFTNRIKKMESQIQNMKTTSAEIKPVDNGENK